MPFLYNGANALWNTAASYCPSAVKYCQDNNISWSTIGNVASELASVFAGGPLSAVHQSGKATMTAAASAVASVVPAWTLGAKDLVSQAAHSALAAPHAWYFGGDPAKGGTSTTMTRDLAMAAGTQALQLGGQALKSVCTVFYIKAAEFAHEVTATLDQLENRLLGPDIFLEAEGAVFTVPAFGAGEDSDLLAGNGVAAYFGNHGHGAQGFAQRGQAPMAVHDDFAMEGAPPVCLAGIGTDMPAC
ncbi:hypothetical protein [Comamonas endophytica]|uniref:Uncharacterized protein n=1 Tax=Comamonas endophytica TaxID=2949090 RepID=A0ABY6GBM4_9BURK|nr:MULTISPECIES: hypothetical protein [unclassified Acidovorax]MCD2513536.1 hypothetical protein [Acidovorax sp. D4N7]UYG52453.1 hypothetical protein M9799_04200 [Acidovorax sp. 5MLIR]